MSKLFEVSSGWLMQEATRGAPMVLGYSPSSKPMYEQELWPRWVGVQTIVERLHRDSEGISTRTES